MARSSTTYAPKWRCGKTCVLRVPEVLADDVMTYARGLDSTRADQVREDGANYTLEARPTNRPLCTEKPVNVASVPQRSPFRYPGGKTWLVPILRAWLRALPQKPSLFLEPFAGGGIASLTVAFEKLAGHAVMAETDEGVASVWKTILTGQGNWLAQEILDFELTTGNVRKALDEDAKGSVVSLRRRAFLTLLRNRVQRGGIMAPGAGLVKNGENNRGLGSRWYPETLARRIREIDMNLKRLSFCNGDGFTLIDEYLADPQVALYIDPPYTKAAKRLYRNWQVDHRQLFEKMTTLSGSFLMSYDNEKEIRDLALKFGFDAQGISSKPNRSTDKDRLVIGRNMTGWLHP